MSGVDAAATLSLKIDTSSAAKSLENLEQKYSKLRSELGHNISLGSIDSSVKSLQAGLSAVAGALAATNHALDDIKSSGGKALKPLQENAKALAQSNTLLADSFTRVASSSSVAAKSAVQYNSLMGTSTLAATGALVQANTLLADSNTKVAASAPAAARSMVQYNSLMGVAVPVVEKLAASNVLLADSNTKVAASAPAAARSMVQYNSLMGVAVPVVEKLAASNVLLADSNTKVAASANAASTSMVRYNSLMGAIPTSQPRSTGNALLTNSTVRSAAPTQSTTASSVVHDSLMNAAKPVVELEQAHKTLAPAIKQSADHQLHWNKIADEGHAAVRGLSGSLGTLWITYGSLAPLLAGAALGAAFKQTATLGSEFAYQLTFVKALGNETTETVARLSEAAKSLGQNSLQGPTELASGFRILAQAGLTGADSILAMSSVLDLAVVGEMEMAQAGTTLVGVMNAFSLSVNSASHVGDVFAKAAALSQTSVQGMTEAMKTASVVGEQYGASMEDVATALTLLAKVNITGTAAGTSLRNMLKELYAPTAGAASAFKQLGISTSDAGGKLKSFPTIIYELRGQLEKFDKPSQINILQKMFGERGAKEAISMLALTRDEWDKLNGSISQSSGFMRKVAADLEGTTKGAFTQAINALKTSFVTAFESTEGPMKAMALRLQSLFSSQEFQDGVVSAVSLIGKFASALLSAATGLSTLVALMPNGTATFVAMAAAVGGTTLALAAMASKIASASGLLSGFGIAGMAALSPLAPLYIAVGALTAAYVLFNSKTPESISNINALNFALDTQISRLKLVNSELIKKIGLESGNAAVESAAARKEIVAGKAQLAEYDNVLAADAASKKSGQSTVIGDMLGNIFTTDEKKREGYAKVIEARTKRSELAAKIAKAELNLKIAEGYEDEIRINSAKAQVKDLLKQQEAESKLKSGTEKFVPGDRTRSGGGGSTKVRDYTGDLEKSNIASLVERQQEDLKVLELTHKNHLISEDQYQAQLAGIYATWGPRIEEEYSSSIARLAKLQAASSGDQAAQYEKKRKDMETAYRKFQFDEAYRSADSLAAEMGRIKKSGDEIQKIIEEQQANTDQIMERLAATRIKLDLTPEQAAGYDARKAVEKPMDKAIAGKQAEAQSLLNAGYDEESASLKAVRAEIELLLEARARLAGQAAAQAEAEVGFARSYEFGWKSAFRAWTDEGTNAAKTAADSFAAMTAGMENLLDNFLTTGKLGFADFAKSVILSIAKIEAKAALSQGLKAIGGNGGGGFGGIISGILGAITGGGGGFSAADFANLAASHIDSAKGNVFSGSPSLHAYANTVQTSPKTFAFQNLHGFARGGVFAEAGPEAVMPLSRDSRGRLGVKASSEGAPINITVHVNGNSNAPDVRRAAGQGAREALAAFNGARRYA